jgi:hypothetical protein
MKIEERKIIFSETLVALIHARRVRIGLGRLQLALPEIESQTPMSGNKLKKVVGQIKFTLSILLFLKPGPCFYRSFAFACVLRKRGVPIELNFGCKNLREIDGRARAHCWLTIGGDSFQEDRDPREDYPVYAGTNGKGINFWLAP